MIQPGIGTSKYKLGCDFYEIDLPEPIITEVEGRGELSVYKTQDTWFFVNKQNNKLEQISLFKCDREKVLDKVGLGDSLETLTSSLGECAIIDGVYEPKCHAGVSFEVDEHNVIYCISVSLPFQFHGNLPPHIKNNLFGKKRKLP